MLLAWMNSTRNAHRSSIAIVSFQARIRASGREIKSPTHGASSSVVDDKYRQERIENRSRRLIIIIVHAKYGC